MEYWVFVPTPTLQYSITPAVPSICCIFFAPVNINIGAAGKSDFRRWRR